MEIKKLPTFPTLMKKKQVAAYARVSSGKDAMLHSLSAQISYYSAYIQKRPEWLYRGVYVDEAITGTKTERPEFQRLLSDCRAGKIDMVITKSISRFARNTVTLLETVRELKALNIDVFFEEPNIHTLSAAGEMMLTILASVAQEESRMTSERMKWRVRKNFEEGVPWNSKLLGYRLVGDRYVIVPDEADTVRRIYSLFLSGMGPLKIAKVLNDEGRLTSEGYPWRPNGVSAILRNDAYTGNLTLQKTFRIDYKHGRGVLVEADHNPQMMLYALGALVLFDHLYYIDTVSMTIYQPRKGNVSTFTIPKQELLDWAEYELKPAAQKAWNGEGEYACGDWCQFCKAKQDCRERARANLEMLRYDFRDPPLLSDDEIESVLAKADELIAWATDVKDYAFKAALDGKHWRAFKLVEGRSIRRYTDEAAVAVVAENAGYTDIYKKTLIPITEMEKAMGKKKFQELLGSFVVKPQGKPTLVPRSDKRSEMNQNNIMEDFANE